MDGVIFFPWRLFGLVMVLVMGGVCVVVAPAYASAWASGGGSPPWRPRLRGPLRELMRPPTRFERRFAWAFATSFFLAGTCFCLVKYLGQLVGGTTNSPLAGMGPDGTYRLYAWWRPDQHQPVSAEKFHALYFIENQLFPIVFSLPFVMLALLALIERFRGNRLRAAPPADDTGGGVP